MLPPGLGLVRVRYNRVRCAGHMEGEPAKPNARTPQFLNFSGLFALSLFPLALRELQHGGQSSKITLSQKIFPLSFPSVTHSR